MGKDRIRGRVLRLDGTDFLIEADGMQYQVHNDTADPPPVGSLVDVEGARDMPAVGEGEVAEFEASSFTIVEPGPIEPTIRLER